MESGTPTTAERILAGAAVVVAAHGMAHSTVQHILVQAGVSRRTFYQHFPSIEGVVCDLYIQHTDRLLTTITAAVSDRPQARLAAAVDAWVAAQASARPLLIHLQAEAIRPGSMLAPVRRQLLDDLVALLGAGLELRGLLMGVEGLLMERGADPAAREAALGLVRGRR